MRNKKVLANLLAMLLMLFWGISYLSIKVVVEEIDPTVSAFYRFFIAAVILFGILRIKFPEEKILKEDRIKLILGGLFGVALYFFFENYSISFTSASNVAILISAIPIFTLMSQRILFKEKLNLSKFMGVILSAVGLVIIIASKERVSLFSTGTLGDLMALGAVFSWIIYNVLTSNFKGNYKSITITAYQVLYGCIFLSPSLVLTKLKVPSPLVIGNIIFLSIFCSCLGYIIYIFCLEQLGATVITTYINLQPIVSLISAYILLHEKVTKYQITGSLIIIAGVLLVSRQTKFNEKEFEELI